MTNNKKIHLQLNYPTDTKLNLCVLLTDAGQQIIEPLFGEKRVLQTTEVKFENAGHWVDVMIILIVRQRVVS